MAKISCCVISGREEKIYESIKDHLEEIKSQGENLSYAKGQVVFYEGHSPFGFFLLKKGEVVLSSEVDSPGLVGGRKKHDNFLGLVHLVSDTPYCTTCKAMGDVEVVFYPKSVLLAFLQKK